MPERRRSQPPAIAIRIDRLQVRLSGVDAAIAREALAGLGPELARQVIAQDAALSGLIGRTAGTISVPPMTHNGSDAGSLRIATARAVAKTIVGSGTESGGTP